MPISLPLATRFRRIVRGDSALFAQLILSIPWPGWQQVPSLNNSLVPYSLLGYLQQCAFFFLSCQPRLPRLSLHKCNYLHRNFNNLNRPSSIILLNFQKETRLTPGRNITADGLVQCINFRYGSAAIFGDQRNNVPPSAHDRFCLSPWHSGLQAGLRPGSAKSGSRPTDLMSVCRWR